MLTLKEEGCFHKKSLLPVLWSTLKNLWLRYCCWSFQENSNIFTQSQFLLIQFLYPLKVILKTVRESHCHFCLTKLPRDVVFCSSCTIPFYCSEKCREAAAGKSDETQNVKHSLFFVNCSSMHLSFYTLLFFNIKGRSLENRWSRSTSTFFFPPKRSPMPGLPQPGYPKP